MSRLGWAVAWIGLVGCSGSKADCTPLVGGPWTVDGDAFGMAMETAVTMDAEGCTFTLTEWSMEMESIPSGGSVDGDEVTLAGDDEFWATCTGTIGDDGSSVEGACDNGDAFSMVAGALTESTMSM